MENKIKTILSSWYGDEIELKVIDEIMSAVFEQIKKLPDVKIAVINDDGRIGCKSMNSIKRLFGKK